MKKLYRKKDRVVTIEVSLTIDQVAVLMNHCLYRSMFPDGPSDLSLKAEVQFAMDHLCSDGNGYHEFADSIREAGGHPLAFDLSRLPDPQ
jgi:hypothetical protein